MQARSPCCTPRQTAEVCPVAIPVAIGSQSLEERDRRPVTEMHQHPSLISGRVRRNKTRVAVVGAGHYGTHHINAYRRHPDMDLVAVCDSDPVRGEELARSCGARSYSRLEDMLKKETIHVVSVATPDPSHTAAILTALRYGKSVLAETPLATSGHECELIAELAARQDLLLGVDFHQRWEPVVKRIRAELEKPETGRILQGHIRMDTVVGTPVVRRDWAADSSPVWFLGSHCFDLVRHISGLEVVSVFAVGQKRVLVECGLDTWDSVQTLLTMTGGSTWVVENAWVLPEGCPAESERQIDILCEAASFHSSSRSRGLEITTQDKTLTPDVYYPYFPKGVAGGYGISAIDDFIKAVRDGTPYPVTAQDGLAASRICEAVHRSLISGHPEPV